MAKTKVDKDLIRELAALMEETGLSEIEIERDDDRMRLVRATAPIAPVIAVPTAAPTAAGAVAAPAPAGDGSGDLSAHPGAVPSPLVGTAYHSASPDAAPFVKVGDQISAGQTLLVIEAMKTFNEIPAPKSGVVTQILFDNATPVEYGDILMIVE
ncbi:MAG: acetyl-CoA carboxylase biotin carboxyl carrier protein [Rhodospirillaceae bacterium]|jgi:acetyl-CoA carboxylase biotin carboxyl carrier protein|nr:acetyl-CoA carboxylase biotin carboxyl carrier protein [Rhodospirillaceae bacterium]MBT4487117.1 acetyl-CoA carboxylase biotin carboxyl carrier protein [Rhodospirillaceae bacterium]MBT5896053.1 acetyl-CoA carboxylase biotin carboxyl carrier protein [Rhodospirillaceae bacterium]MBT6428668.1 acetyl-CoA carboxylase biotin carboxyl carrier protein [Rhodospirillaceae bacterium]MBT7757288.1 acetyl-CoA carboxylase biotin carboxyl carrier protein [Rhodospirillaceae bacterium]